MHEINETHDPNLKSWVESANDPNTDFPIQNLPFCMFWRSAESETPHLGIGIGDQIFDLHQAIVSGVLGSDFEPLAEEVGLCDLSFLAEVYGTTILSDLRLAAFDVLRDNAGKRIIDDAKE